MRSSHRSAAWSGWDGGQAGGRPSWLNPHQLPRQPVQCTCCESDMHFLCQLYAPMDGEAFHRSFYVFGCPRMTDPKHDCAAGIRVLRTQLPQDNGYWPATTVDDDESTDWTKHLAENYHKNGLCAYCGFPATGKCPLQQKPFCGPRHQRLYKKHNKNNQLADDDTEVWKSQTKSNLPGVYHMTEIVVEEEPPLPAIVELKEQDRPSTLYPSNDDDESDSDADLEQEDLNQIVTGNKEKKKKGDATYQKFLQRCTERPNCKGQVLRYCRWPAADDNGDNGDDENNGPLWIRSDHRPDTIPPCSHCGAERRFEFQIMPQLLHYLTNDVAVCATTVDSEDKPDDDYDTVKAALEQADSLVQQAPPEQVPPSFVEAKNAAVKRVRNQLLKGGGRQNNSSSQLDWGVVVVYTCTGSCSAKQQQAVGGDDDDSNNNEAATLGAYREEYAWRQPSIDGDDDDDD